MKKILSIVVTLVILSGDVQAAVLSEDFEDGDYTANPAWVIDGSLGVSGGVVPDPNRPSNLVYKAKGGDQGFHLLATEDFDPCPWEGFHASVEFLTTTSDRFSSIIEVRDHHWDMEPIEWLQLVLQHDAAHGDQAVLYLSEWDSVLLDGSQHFFWFDLADVPINEWLRLSLWNDPVDGVIRGDLRRVSDDLLIVEGSFTPVNFETNQPIGCVRIGIQELEWQYLDNISLTTNTFFVDDNALYDPGPGDTGISDPNENGSMAHPFDAIQEALDAAYDAGTVIVLDGTYTGNGNRDLHIGSEALTLRSENGPENCIIDCEGNGRGIDFAADEGASSVVDGFTIKNAEVAGGFPGGYGAGIRCTDCSPTIHHCIFLSNRANHSGGGIGIIGGSPTISGCTFIDNSGIDGSGIAVHLSSQLTIMDCVFIDNHSHTSSGDGGGIFNGESDTAVSNCLMVGNTARCGGAIRSQNGGDMKVINCTLSGNSATLVGGGVYFSSNNLEMSNCIVWDNTDNSGSVEAAQIYVHPVVGEGNVDFCCVQGWTGALGGSGNISQDPLFAAPGYWNFDSWVNGDYHLQSQAGRWDVDNQTWVLDAVTSPCIDAGDPATAIGWEPFPNGGIVNMGAYGALTEASKSYFGDPICDTPIAGDINGDCIVNLLDLALMGLHWLEENQN